MDDPEQANMNMSMSTSSKPVLWTVYRDGERWTVHARHLAGALAKACLQTDALSGRQFVDAGTKREPCEPPALDSWQLPIVLRNWGGLSSGVEAVYLHDATTVQLRDVTGIEHAFACRVSEHASKCLSELRRDTDARMVRDVKGHPIAVQCYKTGPKGSSARATLGRGQSGKLSAGGLIEWSNTVNMHHVLADLEQVGAIKWPSKTTAAEKMRVLEGIIHNVELSEAVQAFEVLVAMTAMVCELLVPPPKPLAELTEAELRERRAEYEAELAEHLPSLTARYEIVERIAAIDRRLDVFDSIREHGFAVGTVVDVLPASWSDDQETRRGRVTEVRVEHKPTYFGREPATQHRRLIEFFDGTDATQPEVDRLRLVTLG